MIQLQPDVPVIVERGSTRPATGLLWLTIDGRPFPAEGWDDFVVVVTAALANAVARLLSGVSREEVVYFMDGPHKLLLEHDGDGARLTAQTRDGEVDAASCDLADFAEQLLERARLIESTIAPTRDGHALRRAASALRTAHQARAQRK